MRLPLRVSSLLVLLIFAALPLEARVLRVEITSRADVLNGKAFGDVGAYGAIVGAGVFLAGGWNSRTTGKLLTLAMR